MPNADCAIACKTRTVHSNKSSKALFPLTSIYGFVVLSQRAVQQNVRQIGYKSAVYSKLPFYSISCHPSLVGEGLYSK